MHEDLLESIKMQVSTSWKNFQIVSETFIPALFQFDRMCKENIEEDLPKKFLLVAFKVCREIFIQSWAVLELYEKSSSSASIESEDNFDSRTGDELVLSFDCDIGNNTH